MDYPVNCHTLNSWWKYLVYVERDPQTNIYTDGTLSDNCLYVNWTPPFLSLNIHMSKYGGGQTLDPEYHLVNIVLRVRETLPAILRRKIHKSAIVSNWFMQRMFNFETMSNYRGNIFLNTIYSMLSTISHTPDTSIWSKYHWRKPNKLHFRQISYIFCYNRYKNCWNMVTSSTTYWLTSRPIW